MKIHILGVCGTFMAGVAIMAKESGHEVVGYDSNVYPPMSTQLEKAGITLIEDKDFLEHINDAELVVIGNAKSRGHAIVEHVLNQRIPFMSGPEWLAKTILKDKWVLAVSGTHGKTTTSSMLAWILEYAGLKPGFLIGGIAANFTGSARCGEGEFFVVEADEYDSAFFDKRSKFIHYSPRTLIMNNLEFDHADIFDSLDDIKKQFHYLVRTVPANGRILYPQSDKALQSVLARGCWSEQETLGDDANWSAKLLKTDGSVFNVFYHGENCGEVSWTLLGQHNVNNALAAIAAANHVGVSSKEAISALNQFAGVKRRLELIQEVNGVAIYDDFAHHPTAIASTIQGLRDKIGDKKIIAVMQCGSYTMRIGYHQGALLDALDKADRVLMLKPQSDVFGFGGKTADKLTLYESVEEIIDSLQEEAKSGDSILIMSNQGFGGIYEKLPAKLKGGANEKI